MSSRGQSRSLAGSSSTNPQISESAGGGSARPQTSQADSAGSIPVTRSTVVSQDIVDACLRTSWTGGQPLWLVVAGWVEGELAQRPVEGEDADVEVGSQDCDPGSGVPPSDADVVELAAVAQGDGAAGVDGVLADPAVGRDGHVWSGGQG